MAAKKPVVYGGTASAPKPTPTQPAPLDPLLAEQQNVARQKAGTYADDSADAGNASTGDPYLDELRSGNVAGSEDWRRMSNAQLKAWQPFYVGNGKFRNKYGDIVDKPDDVGPNTPPGYNGTGDYIGGGGGAGVPKGAGAVAAAPVDLGAAQGTLGKQLQYSGNELQDTLIDQFNKRAGIFGTGYGAEPGATSRVIPATKPAGNTGGVFGFNNPGAAPTPAPEVQGISLPGGGLWWGQGANFDFKPMAAPTGGGGGGGMAVKQGSLPSFAALEPAKPAAPAADPNKTLGQPISPLGNNPISAGQTWGGKSLADALAEQYKGRTW